MIAYIYKIFAMIVAYVRGWLGFCIPVALARSLIRGSQKRETSQTSDWARFACSFTYAALLLLLLSPHRHRQNKRNGEAEIERKKWKKNRKLFGLWCRKRVSDLTLSVCARFPSFCLSSISIAVVIVFCVSFCYCCCCCCCYDRVASFVCACVRSLLVFILLHLFGFNHGEWIAEHISARCARRAKPSASACIRFFLIDKPKLSMFTGAHPYLWYLPVVIDDVFVGWLLHSQSIVFTSQFKTARVMWICPMPHAQGCAQPHNRLPQRATERAIGVERQRDRDGSRHANRFHEYYFIPWL